MCKDIQTDLSIHETDVYSLDFAYCADEDKRYLIEINSAPGIWFPEEDKHYQHKFYHDLADHFHYLIKTYASS